MSDATTPVPAAPIPTLPQSTWQGIADSVLRVAMTAILGYIATKPAVTLPDAPQPAHVATPEELWQADTTAKISELGKKLDDLAATLKK